MPLITAPTATCTVAANTNSVAVTGLDLNYVKAGMLLHIGSRQKLQGDGYIISVVTPSGTTGGTLTMVGDIPTAFTGAAFVINGLAFNGDGASLGLSWLSRIIGRLTSLTGTGSSYDAASRVIELDRETTSALARIVYKTAGVQKGAVELRQISISGSPVDCLDFRFSADGTAWASAFYIRLDTGAVSLTLGKTAVGLGNVDNTSDADKPVSTAQQAAIVAKVSKAGDTMTGALFINMAGYAYVVADAGAVESVFAANGAGITEVGSLTNHGVRFLCDSVEKMRITPGGNVGIGTTTPGVKLEVASAIRIGDAAQSYLDMIGGALNFRLDANGSIGGALMGNASNHPLIVTTNNTERMRIEASGNVGIGTASPGANLDANFESRVSHTGYPRFSLYTSAAATNEKLWQIFSDGASKALNIGAIDDAQTTFSPALTIYRAGEVVSSIAFSTTFAPAIDNTYDVGAPSFRVKQYYGVNGAINTSDGREKTAVRPFADAEMRAAQNLAREIGVYQWLASIAEKGDAARLHIGMTVQRAIEIMEAEGLDPWRYGFICRDEITKRVKVTKTRSVQATEEVEEAYSEIEVRDGVPVQVSKSRLAKRPVVEMVAVVDEDGEPVMRQVPPTVEGAEPTFEPHMHPVPVMINEEYETEEEQPDGDRLGFRYDQLTLFIARGQVEIIAAQEARIAALEGA